MNSRLEKKGMEAMIESGAVARDRAEQLFAESEKNGESFSQAAVREGLIQERDMIALYSRTFGFPQINLKKESIDGKVFEKVPVKFAWYYRFFPYAQKNGKICIAVSRPVDVNFIDEVRFGLGLEVEIALATDREIEEMLQKHYGLGAETVDKILTKTAPAGEEASAPAVSFTAEVEDIEKMAENASVIQLVNQILLNAYRKGASDIHLEPFRGKVRLRYRVDGVLQEAPVPPEMKKFFSAIVSRIKIMANLNIVERRLPQDGRARVKTQNQNLDLRISSIPTPHGESVVIRILPGQMIREIGDLGLDEDQVEIFQELLRRPHGIIFVTGPTGSGKSTTLYAGLSQLNSEERKVITIEDPVEYELEGVTQIQVAPDVGLTFAQGLRSVLRHDPDVMMIGEVRDLETADIAIRVALTGHLILSTLHTNDAASGVTRLLDIGVEPYLVASSVVCFIAQRLVRLTCSYCKQEDREVLPEIIRLIRREAGLEAGESITIYRGKGCDHCNGTGFSGRIAVYEFLPVTETLRKLIFQRSSSEEIKKLARVQGMKTMRQNGWKKVLKGLTTPEEIFQVTPDDEEMGPPPPEETAAEPAVRKVEKGSASEQSWEESASEVSGPYVNRRAYIRIQASLPLRFRPVDLERDERQAEDDDFGFEDALTQDISANGLSFILKREVPPGTALDLRISLPGVPAAVECISRVVRVSKMLESAGTPSGFVYHIGVTYLAINSTDRLKIEKYCKENQAK